MVEGVGKVGISEAHRLVMLSVSDSVARDESVELGCDRDHKSNGKLNPQFHHRRSTPTFILRGLGD